METPKPTPEDFRSALEELRKAYENALQRQGEDTSGAAIAFHKLGLAAIGVATVIERRLPPADAAHFEHYLAVVKAGIASGATYVPKPDDGPN